MAKRKLFLSVLAVVLALATVASAYAVNSIVKEKNAFQIAAAEGGSIEQGDAVEDFKFTSFDSAELQYDEYGSNSGSSVEFGDISEELVDGGFVPASGEISTDSKINIYNKMLNTIDFFNNVTLTMETSMLSDSVTIVEYQSDINAGAAYQAVSEDGLLLSETYSEGTNMIFVNTEAKTYTQNYLATYSRSDTAYIPLEERIITAEDGLPCYRYRRNVTNCPLASYSLFPQEIAFSYLKDFDKWYIEDDTAMYLGRTCVVIAGTPSPYIAGKHSIDSFTMVVDSATGVLLEFCGTLDGEVSRYMAVTECTFESRAVVKQFDQDSYSSYTELSRW